MESKTVKITGYFSTRSRYSNVDGSDVDCKAVFTPGRTCDGLIHLYVGGTVLTFDLDGAKAVRDTINRAISASENHN